MVLNGLRDEIMEADPTLTEAQASRRPCALGAAVRITPATSSARATSIAGT